MENWNDIAHFVEEGKLYMNMGFWSVGIGGLGRGLGYSKRKKKWSVQVGRVLGAWGLGIGVELG